MKIVRTYATSANLGPGFDAFGICLNLYNEYSFETNDKYEIHELNEKYNDPSNNLIIKSYEEVFNRLNKKIIPIKLNELVHDIPTSRGLGSSASCIVTGVMIANCVLDNILSKEEVFQIASEIEGHPDNVAPLIYGGLTCSFKNDKFYTVKCCPDDKFIYTVCIPSFELKTSVARSVLPESIKLADAVSNISHSVALIKALELGDMQLLKIANVDKLHQNYRFPLIKDASYFINYCKNNNATCMISGAGPTILLISKDSLDLKFDDWKIIEQKVNYKGAYIYER